MFRRITPPRIAVQKGTLTWYSRSDPGSGPSCTAPPRPPKIPEKISRKLPAAGVAGFSALGAFEHVGEVEAAEIEVCTALPPPPDWSARETLTPVLRRAASGAGISVGGCGIDVVGVKTDLVVDLPLLGIAQNIVGFRERLELFFRSLVAGIDVRMVFTRQFTERLADIVRRGGILHAENFVIVFSWWWWPLRLS